MVVDTCGQFFLIMRHHDERLVLSLAEGLDDVFHQSAVGHVESMQWFVEDEQLRVFDKGTSQENESPNIRQRR